MPFYSTVSQGNENKEIRNQAQKRAKGKNRRHGKHFLHKWFGNDLRHINLVSM